MSADAFRQLYDYHFSENHKIWDSYLPLLSDEDFLQDVGYSYGSVKSQIVHLINAETAWFCELRGVEVPEDRDPASFADRGSIRAHWDDVEGDMRAYLAGLRDEMLFLKPFPGEDENLTVWQVLLHVVNHGTDHRAQLLRMLSDLGVRTEPQDFVFYVYEHAETGKND